LGQNLSPKRKGRCGTKPIITPRCQRKIKNCIISNRKGTYKQINHKLKEVGIDVAEITLRRHAYKLGFKSRRPRKKPKLTPNMIKKRLSWAKKYSNFTIDDWSTVSKQFIIIIMSILQK
jgi:hypothetical protein